MPANSEPRPFLTAEWRRLLMLNYVCDPKTLEPLTPPGTELDLWRGRCYLSIVGFLFLNTKVLGLPVPWHRNFEEVNLRFYVRRRDPLIDDADHPDAWRRGVVFIREIVPKRAIAWVARTVYQENYVYCPMDSRIDDVGSPNGGRVEYGWQWAHRRQHLSARFDGAPTTTDPLSEAGFITEHYWGYAAQRSGNTMEYRVTHPPWRTWPADRAEFVCDTNLVYGPQFAPFLQGAPTSAFIAEGSPVAVHKGRKLPDT